MDSSRFDGGGRKTKGPVMAVKNPLERFTSVRRFTNLSVGSATTLLAIIRVNDNAISPLKIPKPLFILILSKIIPSRSISLGSSSIVYHDYSLSTHEYDDWELPLLTIFFEWPRGFVSI